MSPLFLLLCGWFAWGCGWEALTAALLAAGIHEGGHWLVLKWNGVRISAVRIGILGAVMETDAVRLSYGRELAAVLAGPAANLAAALALLSGGNDIFLGANIALFLFNLLPLPLLDGGRALRLLLCFFLGPVWGERIAALTGRIFALLLGLALAALMVGSAGSLWLLPSCGASLWTVVKKSRNS